MRRRVTTTVAVALGAALLAGGLPRANPADPRAIVALTLLVVAVVSAVVCPAPADRRTALLALPAAAALVVVSVGHGPAATLAERDLQIGLLPLVVPLLAAGLIGSPWLAATSAVGGLVAGPLRILFYDPFLDPECPACEPGQLVLWPAPELAAALHPIGVAIAATAVMIAVVLAVAKRQAPVVLVALLGCLMLYAADVVRYEVVFVGAGLTIAWLARTAALSWQHRREVRRLLRGLDAGDDLTTVLRRELRDPDLVVTFPDGTDLVDRTGSLVLTEQERATTDLLVDGALIARVHHARGTRVPEVGAVLDDAARLALGNERLTAQLAARVRELRRARAAVVETGVRERRALERDLHDGVQQDLLALGLDLRVAAAERAPDDPDRERLDDLVVRVRATLDEVRDVSHGVYPPLLATRGLAAAATSLARRTSSPVEVGSLPAGRFDHAVERAGFAVLAEAVDRGAQHVEAEVADGRLIVRATGAGPGMAGILPDLVAAVGGTVDLDTPVITAVIPCE